MHRRPPSGPQLPILTGISSPCPPASGSSSAADERATVLDGTHRALDGVSRRDAWLVAAVLPSQDERGLNSDRECSVRLPGRRVTAARRVVEALPAGKCRGRCRSKAASARSRCVLRLDGRTDAGNERRLVRPVQWDRPRAHSPKFTSAIDLPILGSTTPMTLAAFLSEWRDSPHWHRPLADRLERALDDDVSQLG